MMVVAYSTDLVCNVLSLKPFHFGGDSLVLYLTGGQFLASADRTRMYKVP